MKIASYLYSCQRVKRSKMQFIVSLSLIFNLISRTASYDRPPCNIAGLTGDIYNQFYLTPIFLFFIHQFFTPNVEKDSPR